MRQIRETKQARDDRSTGFLHIAIALCYYNGQQQIRRQAESQALVMVNIRFTTSATKQHRFLSFILFKLPFGSPHPDSLGGVSTCRHCQTREKECELNPYKEFKGMFSFRATTSHFGIQQSCDTSHRTMHA